MPRSSARGRSLHVLVIDDEPAVLQKARARLEFEGHRVTTTSSIESLDFMIGTLDPDLVLMDVMMPGLSGRELNRLLELHAGQFVLHSSIPVRALRYAVDVRNALGVIIKTENDVEFFFAFNDLVDRLSRVPVRHADHGAPATSGMYRIAEEATDTDVLPIWASRTGSGG